MIFPPHPTVFGSLLHVWMEREQFHHFSQVNSWTLRLKLGPEFGFRFHTYPIQYNLKRETFPFPDICSKDCSSGSNAEWKKHKPACRAEQQEKAESAAGASVRQLWAHWPPGKSQRANPVLSSSLCSLLGLGMKIKSLGFHIQANIYVCIFNLLVLSGIVVVCTSLTFFLLNCFAS